MKPLLKLLARLYPSTWRNRYGAEYEALLDDATPRPQDAFNILWGAIKMQLTSRSFARIVLPCAIAGALIASAITFAIQPRYVSQTLITVTQGNEPLGHHLGNVRQDAIGDALRSMKDNFLSSESLAPIVEEQNLYPRERGSMPPEAVIDRMRRDITIIPRDSAFALQFNYPDPHVAQKVDRELVSSFISANLRVREDSDLAGHPLPNLVFRVADQPTLPQKPFWPNRRMFGATGLLTGLAAGLILALTRLRKQTTAANG